MRAFSLLFLMSVATPLHAQAVSAPAGSANQITSDGYNLANCAVALNAGSVRWMRALFSNSPPISSDLLEGAKGNALQAVMYRCPVNSEKPDVGAAVRFMAMAISFHPNAVNSKRGMDDLADCLVKGAPAEARRYLEESDKAGLSKKGMSGGDASESGYKALFEAKGNASCAGLLDAKKGQISANELYARINWQVRAQPYFQQAAASGTVKQ